MNWVDYTIIAVLLLSVLIGLWRGLVSEVMALGVWIAAVWLAWAFGDDVASLFQHSIDLPSARLLLGYGICFLATLLAGALLRFVITKLVEGTGLSGSDRLLGMLFGLARGLLLVVVAVTLLGFTPFPRDPWWQQSRLLPSFEGAAAWAVAYLPEDMGTYLDFKPAAIPAAMAGQMLLPARPASADGPAQAASVQHAPAPPGRSPPPQPEQN